MASMAYNIGWMEYLVVLLMLLFVFIFIIAFQLRRVVSEVPSQVLVLGENSELSRDLSLFDITMLGVGAMIGAGIFVLTGLAAGIAGPGLLLAFLLNGFATSLTALVYAELGSAVPEAGGGYLWVKSSMGRYQAFLSGWMSWLAHIVAGSLYSLGFGSYFVFLLEELGFLPEDANKAVLEKVFAVIIILLFLLVNYLGSSETGSVGNIITVTKVIIIAVFILSGLWAALKAPNLRFRNLEPIIPPERTIFSILTAMGFTFIAFEGYEIIVQTGEEVEQPNRSIPRAIFFSLLIVVPIYFFVGLVSLTAITPAPGEETWQFLSSIGELGLAEAARQFMPLGVGLMLFGGLVSTLSALNATIYSSARVSFVMGRDKLLPRAFNQVNEWRRTPHVAILVSGAIMIGIAVFLPIDDVASAADLLFVLLFLQVNLSIFKIRSKYGEQLFYGYKIPLYPVLPIISVATQIILGVALILHSDVALIGASLWLVIGTIVWFGIIKRNLTEEITDSFAHYIIKPKVEENMDE